MGWESCKAVLDLFCSVPPPTPQTQKKHVTMWAQPVRPDWETLWPGRSSRNRQQLGSAPWDKNCNTATPPVSSAPPDNMDCGIATSKIVLLFLSLVFWVSRGGVCPPAEIFFILNWRFSGMEFTAQLFFLSFFFYTANHRYLILFGCLCVPVCFKD